MPRKIDPLNKKLYGSVTTMLTVGDVKAGSSFLSKGIRLCKKGNHEWPRRQGNTCRIDAPWYDINVGAGSPADGFAQCENNRSLTGEFVSADGERRQGGCKGRKTWGRAQGTRDGYVLGRPLWKRCRSRGLRLDDRNPHCTTHASGNEKEDEGSNVQPIRQFSGVSCRCHGPLILMMVHRLYAAFCGRRLRRIRRPG